MARLAPVLTPKNAVAALLQDACDYCEAVLTLADIPDSAAAKAAVLAQHRGDLPAADVPLLDHLPEAARAAVLQDPRTLAQLVRDRLAYLADIADRLAHAQRTEKKIFGTLATFLTLAGRWASIAVQTRQLPPAAALANAAELLVSQARLPGRDALDQLPLR